MEQQIQLGAFIRDMRTERGLTQQQLADRLGITDKAVSKWERDICFPDITLLRPLSEALGVTVTELLAGQREENEAPPPAVEDVVVSAISYSEKARRKNRLDWRLLAFSGMTAACIIAAATCTICDLAVNRGGYHWSLLVYPSLGLAWLLCTPLLLAGRHPVRWALALLSAVILPYLCGLGWLLQAPMVTKISIWTAPMALVYLWLAYAAFLHWKRRRWLAAGWIALLAVPLSAGINFIVDRYTGQAGHHGVLDVLICLPAAAACFLTDYILEHRRS